MPQVVTTSVTGGYNGGATIHIVLYNGIDGTVSTVFQATGDSPYNLHYDNVSGSFDSEDGVVYIAVTPPVSSSGVLKIELTGGVEETYNIHPNGANTSYGYNFTESAYINVNTILHMSSYGTTFVHTDHGWLRIPKLMLDDAVLPGVQYTISAHMPLLQGASIIGASAPDEQNQNVVVWTGFKTDNNRVELRVGADLSRWELYIDGVRYSYGTGGAGWSWINCGPVLYVGTNGLGWAGTIQPPDVSPANVDIDFLNTAVSFGRASGKYHTTQTYTYYTNDGPLTQDSTLFRALMDIEDPTPSPYYPGGSDDPNGDTDPPEGTGELPNDDLAIGGSPYNDLSAGLYRAYAMTDAQLTAFSDQLWSTDVLDALSRYLQNPADLVLSLMSFPFDVEASATATEIGFNWLNAWGLTSIHASGYRITDGHNQHISFGKIEIPQYSGCFYDYGPYSGIELHLPYIGFVPLKMNECVGRNLYVDYYVDVMTGDFTAQVTSDGYDTINENGRKYAYGTPMLGEYQGNIGKPLPLTQQNLWQVYKKIGETAVAAIVAGGAAHLGAAAASDAEQFGVMASASDTNFVKGGQPLGKTPMQLHDELSRQSEGYYKLAKRSGLAGAANAIVNMQSVNSPIIRNGSVDGSNGRTSSQECFVVISVPDQNVPNNQKILGYPSNIPGPLSKVSGYTEVREIRLHSNVANNNELSEIEEIVRGGIII